MFTKVLKKVHRQLDKKYNKPQFAADGISIGDYRNLDFLTDPVFKNAWESVAEYNNPFWHGKTPDIRYRVHFALWAAKHGLTLEGDFVECGVNTGILSSMIYKVLQFEKSDKRFYLFDTYEGIPANGKTEEETKKAMDMNEEYYLKFNQFEIAKDVFGKYPNAHLVKGVLPESLSFEKIDKIAYLSIDLNVATPEIETINLLWDKISPSALIVLDDYGWRGHRTQFEAWNRFAAEKNRFILNSPTGQGIIIR